MSVRELLNFELLIFAVSGAVIGVTITLALMTDRAAEWMSPDVKWYAIAVGTFGLLVHLYSWSTFVVSLVAYGCGATVDGDSAGLTANRAKEPVAPILRMCALGALCVIGTAILWPATARSDELARFPYEVPIRWEDLPYNELKRIVDDHDGADQWSMVASALHPFAFQINKDSVTNSRIAALAFGALALAWTLVGLMLLEFATIPTIKRKDDGGWTIAVTETSAIVLPANADEAA